MKKTMLMAFCLAAALPAFGQGTIQFQNYDPAHGIDAPQLFGETPADGYNGFFSAFLLGGPMSAEFPVPGVSKGTLTPLVSSTGLQWVPLLSGAKAGYVDVGNGATRVIPGVNWGEQAKIAYIASSGPQSTWDEVWLGYANITWDMSAIVVTLPDDPSKAADSVLRGLQSTTTSYVPEPSVGLLLALGAFATFAARRTRK